MAPKWAKALEILCRVLPILRLPESSWSTPAEPPKINLISISKPIWSYGLESLTNVLPVKGDRLRRVAFVQLALPGVPDLMDLAKQPEEELGRFCRALPLWFAETFSFSPHYHAIARTAQDYERMAMSGVVAVAEPAFWAGFDRLYPETFIDYFRQISEFEPTRAAQYGIRHFCWVAVNPKEAENPTLTLISTFWIST